MQKQAILSVPQIRTLYTYYLVEKKSISLRLQVYVIWTPVVPLILNENRIIQSLKVV